MLRAPWGQKPRRGPTWDVRVATEADELAALERAWRALEEHSAAGVFAGWDWNLAVARHLASGRALHVACLTRDGETVALAPFAYRRFLGIRTLAFLGGGLADYAIADYQDVLLKPGFETAAVATLADKLAGARWDMLWLQELPAGSPVLQSLADNARARGWAAVVVPASDVHRVELPATWEEYVAGLSVSWRKEVRSKLRQLEGGQGARFELVRDAAEVGPAMEVLIDLHTRRWRAGGRPGIFATERSRGFYRDLAQTLHTAGRLYLGVLRTNGGQTIGAALGFDDGETRFAYTYGYEPGREWTKASLGLMLDCYCIRTAIEAGLKCVDLMRSEGAYKRRYGAVRSDNMELMVFRSRSAFVRVKAYRALRSMAKRLLRRGQ